MSDQKPLRFKFPDDAFVAALITLLVISFTIGSIVAFFLWMLDLVTVTRWSYLALIFGLPVAGILITVIYRRYGKASAGGTDLIIREVRDPGKGLPPAMTPLILSTTLITHLFGGSAGREGTAVQMGGSIASFFISLTKSLQPYRTTLLLCGVAAGFGSVFGTPVTGAVFALEAITSGRIRSLVLLPCLLAGFLADLTCSLWGIHHTQFAIALPELSSFFTGIHLNMMLLAKSLLAGMLAGLAALLFVWITDNIKTYSNRFIRPQWLIPAIGAVLIISVSYLIGNFNYLGLGVTTPDGQGPGIVNAFHEGQTPYLSWFWKLLLTAITLGVGFKGGEVTPLFFIGATLGNTVAVVTGSPVDLFAALGLIAVFAGATNAPFACMVMGIELFGSQYVLYYAAACLMAWMFSGTHGIYKEQHVYKPFRKKITL